MRVLLILTFLLISALAGCTGGPGATGDDDDTGTQTPTPTWTPLITGSWSLAAHTEDTNDLHVMAVNRDIYVGGIRPISPLGTHHTVLFRNGPSGILFASGLGTGEVVFPPGVGLKLSPGDNLALQLHIFNAGDVQLSGTSGIEILEIAAADVVHEADIFLPGPTNISLDPGLTTTIGSTCTLSDAQTVFALFPHMHQLGTHFKTTLTQGGTAIALHDAPYAFENQSFTSFAPISLAAGDTIRTECTWVNTTGAQVGYGESSNSEMCYSILYRWPALSDPFCPGI